MWSNRREKKKEHLILLGLKKKEDGYAQGERGRRKRERERKRKKQKGKDHWWKGLEQINSILLSRVESSTRFFLKKHKLIAKKYHEGSPQWNKNRFEDKEKEERRKKTWQENDWSSLQTALYSIWSSISTRVVEQEEILALNEGEDGKEDHDQGQGSSGRTSPYLDQKWGFYFISTS